MDQFLLPQLGKEKKGEAEKNCKNALNTNKLNYCLLNNHFNTRKKMKKYYMGEMKAVYFIFFLNGKHFFSHSKNIKT